jgi:hypothetical protein
LVYFFAITSNPIWGEERIADELLATVKRDGVGGPVGFDFSLDEKAELFAQKQILGRDRSCGLEMQAYEHQSIQENIAESPKCMQKRLHGSILLALKSAYLRSVRNICGTTRSRQLKVVSRFWKHSNTAFTN